MHRPNKRTREKMAKSMEHFQVMKDIEKFYSNFTTNIGIVNPKNLHKINIIEGEKELELSEDESKYIFNPIKAKKSRKKKNGK